MVYRLHCVRHSTYGFTQNPYFECDALSLLSNLKIIHCNPSTNICSVEQTLSSLKNEGTKEKLSHHPYQIVFFDCFPIAQD